MPIDLIALAKIAPIALVAFISPGPDFFLVSSLAMKRGRLSGFASGAGVSLGVMMGAMLAVLGLGYVMAQIAWLLTMIKIIGGLYLMYLGYQLWKSSLHNPKDGEQNFVVSKKKNPFVMGFVTNITNPKALAFNTSVFALAINPDTNLLTLVAIVVMMGCLSLMWFSCVSFGLSTTRVQKSYMRFSKWIDRVAGTFLALFGFKLLLSARN
jgi:threonine efflux protein